jgi:glutamyl-tRNA reductase
VSTRGPTLFVVGASHHTTPLEWREKLAVGPEKMPALRSQFSAIPGLQEFTILNTCNRIEIYGVAADASAIDLLQLTFCTSQNIALDDFSKIQIKRLGLDTLRHLVSVATGLDSQLIGENEIFGQIKAAYAESQTSRTVGPVLNRVFQKAFQTAKHVRTETAINTGQVSIANVAVDLALTIFGNLADARVLLIGAGEIGEQTAKAFRSRGARAITVASRTMSRAMDLATALDARALPFEKLDRHLGEFDVVACATASPGAILTSGMIAQAMSTRPASPLFLIDLALPRDIDPTAAELENVYLYNLDDLAKISDQNLAARLGEVEKAQAIIVEKTARLWTSVQGHAPGTGVTSI